MRWRRRLQAVMVLVATAGLALSACGADSSSPPTVVATATPSVVPPTAAPPTSTPIPVVTAAETLAPSPTATTTLTPTLEATPVTWESGRMMRVQRSEMPAAVYERKIYVPGGFPGGNFREQGDTFEVYDPAADTWEMLAPLPEPSNHHMFVVYNDHMYLFGGGLLTPSTNAWRYDPEADMWDELAPMPEGRYAGAAVVVGDFVYIVGGVGGDSGGALLRYDPAADSWETLAAPFERREHNQAAVLDGEIYAIGGRWGNNSGLRTMEIYTPESDRWRRSATLNAGRSGFGAAVVQGRIVVGGGEIFAPVEALDSVEFYDPDEGIWELAGFTLPLRLHGFPIVAYGDTFYVIGGSVAPGAISNPGSVYVYRGALGELGE